MSATVPNFQQPSCEKSLIDDDSIILVADVWCKYFPQFDGCIQRILMFPIMHMQHLFAWLLTLERSARVTHKSQHLCACVYMLRKGQFL